MHSISVRAVVNPFRAGGGGGAITPMSALKNLTFPNYKSGKGQYVFYPVKLSIFAEKNEVRQKYQNFIRGALTNRVKRLSADKNFQKSNIILEGSRHPHFMNPLEYKLFPKRFGTLTQTKPQIFGGVVGRYAPLLVL